MPDDFEWKKLKLSLERPYKDEQGQLIPAVLDITPEGHYVHEPRRDLVETIGEKLRRIFLERGHDFFEKSRDERTYEPKEVSFGASSETTEDDSATKAITPEELFKLRMEILPQLHIAFGEMSQARDLLSLLLAPTSSHNSSQSSAHSHQPPFAVSWMPTPSQQSQGDPPSSSLTATIAAKPLPIQSVQVFNAQLAMGGKDKALRQAANLFKSSADAMEKGRVRGENYWIDALKMRRGNWSLIPAPLPPGSATGKGADRTSKDFLVSFGLEQSALLFKRRAIGRMPALDADTPKIEFPSRQHTRLQVSIAQVDPDGARILGWNNLATLPETSIDQILRAAQVEIVEQEIFAALIREASNLPTVLSRVSERYIVIEAAQATELRFELVNNDSNPPEADGVSEELQASCDLVYSTLHLLLLRAHAYGKSQRLSQTTSPVATNTPPPILQPIIDILQYRVFCQRVRSEIQKIVDALTKIGMPTKMSFNAVGESGGELISFFQPDGRFRLGGECLLRIDNRRSLRFIFSSPSSLTASLSQATLHITSIPQLAQLLLDEVNNCLLQRICEVGTGLCEHVHGTWFVDSLSSRTVGRWEGQVLNFSISFSSNGAIVGSVFHLERGDHHPVSRLHMYGVEPHLQIPLLAWVHQIVEGTLSTP